MVVLGTGIDAQEGVHILAVHDGIHKTGFEIVRGTSFLDGLAVGTVIGLVSYFRQYTLEKKNGRLALRENLLDDSNEIYDDPLDYERKYRARATEGNE